MATTSVTITEEAYERLKAQKREGESFTDTILRLTEQQDPMSGFGAMADADGFREAAEAARAEFDEDVRERTEETG